MKEKSPKKPPKSPLHDKYPDGKIPFGVMMKLAVNTNPSKSAKRKDKK